MPEKVSSALQNLLSHLPMQNSLNFDSKNTEESLLILLRFLSDQHLRANNIQQPKASTEQFGGEALLQWIGSNDTLEEVASTMKLMVWRFAIYHYPLFQDNFKETRENLYLKPASCLTNNPL
jgi:hypothetical protein